MCVWLVGVSIPEERSLSLARHLHGEEDITRRDVMQNSPLKIKLQRYYRKKGGNQGNTDGHLRPFRVPLIAPHTFCIGL